MHMSSSKLDQRATYRRCRRGSGDCQAPHRLGQRIALPAALPDKSTPSPAMSTEHGSLPAPSRTAIPYLTRIDIV